MIKLHGRDRSGITKGPTSPLLANGLALDAVRAARPQEPVRPRPHGIGLPAQPARLQGTPEHPS